MADSHLILTELLAHTVSRTDRTQWCTDRVVGFRVNGAEYRLDLTKGIFADQSINTDAWLECSSDTLNSLWSGKLLPQAAIERGLLHISGDVELLMRLGVVFVEK